MTRAAWCGASPKGWTYAPLGYYFDVALGKMLNANKDSGNGKPAPYLSAGSIQPEMLVLDETKTMSFSEDELVQYDLRRHDIVVVEGGAGYGRSHLLKDDLPGWGFQNHVARLRARGAVAPAFLLYCLKACLASGYVEANNRTATLPSLSRDVLRSVPVPVPPLREQQSISAYLDRETGRIDILIEEQQRLIEILRERRDSIWAEHVETARRLGRPATVRRIIESIADGPFGSSLTSAHYSDEGARVIRLGNIGINEFKDGDTAFISLDHAAKLHAHTVEKGDVVVAGLGDDRMPLGRAAVVPEVGPAIVKADCYRLRPNEQVAAAYLAWVMSAPQTRSQIMLLARGSTRTRLNTKVVQQVEIPLPDRNTQDALVGQSAADTAKIDRLIAEAERFVELSRERRSALITAAVTGQIDVRETV